MADPADDPGFGLYVHWPFCAAKCPYCDFNSHVTASVDHAAWRDALVSEVRRVAHETGPRPLTSVFFGGGTPSLMAPETVGAVLEAAADCFAMNEDTEITLEANPTSVEAARFDGFHAAGVNRVSLGVQALNDADLRALGRLHGTREALAALDVARARFDRVSFDLIYARQDQSLAGWTAELSRALALGPDHLSLYQLTIEPGTAFGARAAAGGLPGLPDEDLAADMYEATQEICAAAGLPAYEVSNHARPGAESRHNLVYWHCGDFAGIGPGAHGRLTVDGKRVATESHRMPGDWLAAVAAGGGESLRAVVPRNEQAEEMVLMGLRLAEGLSIDRLKRLGLAPDAVQLRDLVFAGYLEDRADRLVATSAGRLVLNRLIAEICAANE